MAELKHSETDLRTSGQLLGTDQALLYIPTEALPADQNQRAALSAIQTYLAASFASTAQGALADSATQPGDNVSSLTNDAGYTNDQTGAEIKSAYEAEANTNAYTDAEKAKVGFVSVTQAVDLDQMESDIAALDQSVVLQGAWDASVGTFPGGGTAQAGYSYIVSVGGTVDGVFFVANDRIVAIADNASTATYAANWHQLDYTDQVLSVVGLTGAVSKSGLLSALNVEDGADATDAANVASTINGATGKTTPVDADELGLIDSAASNALKKLAWADLKATLKTYFDALYNFYTHPNHSGDVTSTGDGATTIANGAVDIAHLSATGTKDATTVMHGDNVFRVPAGGGGGGLTWSVVTGTSQAAAVNVGYFTNNAALCTVTLPSTAAVGDVVRVAGMGAGGWQVAQNASQLIDYGSSTTTTGTGGYLSSTSYADAVELVCKVANTEWHVVSGIGNITIA